MTGWRRHGGLMSAARSAQVSEGGDKLTLEPVRIEHASAPDKCWLLRSGSDWRHKNAAVEPSNHCTQRDDVSF